MSSKFHTPLTLLATFAIFCLCAGAACAADDASLETVRARIAEVFPEYPVSEKKSGVQGVIELALFVEKDGVVTNVQIVKNSTLSKKCENSAIQAAYKTRFLPAKRKNEKIAVWINKIYKFGIN